LNKNKTIWDIVKLETNKTENTDKINTLNIEGTSINNRQEIENIFNKYFVSVAKNINSTHNEHRFYNLNNTTPLIHLLQSFQTPFPNVNLKLFRPKKLKMY
jgi:hypothetical protein